MAKAGRTLAGMVRVDDQVQRLSARLEPGEIAVIDYPDLDRSAALMILARRPLAVLNVASSTTGRRPGLGAQTLVEGGVVLIDDFGTDLAALREGERIDIRGTAVFRKEELIAEGTARTAEDLAASYVDGRGRLDVQVQAFAQGAAILWQRESATLLDGVGIPRPRALEKPRTAVLVGTGEDSVADLKKLRSYGRDYRPAVIAVDEGANQVSVMRQKPDVLVGDPSNVSEKLLRSGAEIVLLERPDGSVPGLQRVTNYGLKYLLMPTSAGGMDAAILLADANGAKEIVTVGANGDLEEFFDQSSSEITSGFFIRVRAATKLVSAKVVAELYRPRISSWQLVWLLLAAHIVLGAAIWFTPWGSDLVNRISDWAIGVWPFAGSNVSPGLAPPITPTI